MFFLLQKEKFEQKIKRYLISWCNIIVHVEASLGHVLDEVNCILPGFVCLLAVQLAEALSVCFVVTEVSGLL